MKFNKKSFCVLASFLCLAISVSACAILKPAAKDLRAINTDGFGTPGNNGIDRMIDAGDYMYLGADNKSGTLVYRSKDKGETWEAICKNGVNGDIANVFTTTVVWFNDYLYIGTWQLQGGAQMFRAKANSGKAEDMKWETITEDGFGNRYNNGFTNGIVFDGYIYVGCFNLTEGSEMWRSKTGDPGTWEMCITKGYGREDNRDSTVLYVYKDYLYVGTESVRGNIADRKGTALYRTKGGEGKIVWEKVSPDGYGDSDNNNTGAIQYYNGYMYVGTWNYYGMQIWRSDMKGSIPWKWENILTGGFDDQKNQACQGIAVVGKDIFCGSFGVIDFNNDTPTGKLLKSSDGVTWTKVQKEGFIEGNVSGVLWMLSSNKKLYVGLYSPTVPSQLWVWD